MIDIDTNSIDIGNDEGAVVDIAYRPPTAGLPIETFTLASLLQRKVRPNNRQLQRVHFELLVCCTAGAARHEVDFESVDLDAGRVLHVRPGQVHRWVLEPPYEAQLVLLRPLSNRRSWKPGPNIIETDSELRQDLTTVLRLANRDGRSAPLSDRSLEAVRDLVIGLLHLDRAPPQDATEPPSIYGDFERLLGGAEPPPRSVHQCAQLLGCSTRTLTRACQSAVGTSPKQLLDQAMALEAQRQLSMGASATEVAEELGFPEPSHFSRFFTRVTGQTPSAFASSAGTTGQQAEL